ncbi:unnamed protein product [Pieris brassicae]|uniref:Uncharacterized protein n=1 Tax=Pieris brassicae TaxID=7116 RepID=A0A9P0XJ59_PIEBR|nr:unnamed protein product [Pieris brassicae]
MRNACGSGGGPAWNEILVIYDPPAAPSPRTPRLKGADKERNKTWGRDLSTSGQTGDRGWIYVYHEQISGFDKGKCLVYSNVMKNAGTNLIRIS